MAGPAGQPVQTPPRRWDIEDPQEVERSKGFRSVSVILRVIHTEAIVDQDTGESAGGESGGPATACREAWPPKRGAGEERWEARRLWTAGTGFR